MSDLSLVYTVNKMYLAQIAQQILEENNIKCHILNKKDSAYVMIGEIELYVSNTDAEKAKELLSNLEN